MDQNQLIEQLILGKLAFFIFWPMWPIWGAQDGILWYFKIKLSTKISCSISWSTETYLFSLSLMLTVKIMSFKHWICTIQTNRTYPLKGTNLFVDICNTNLVKDIISKIYWEDRSSFFEEYFSQVLFDSFSKREKWNKMKLKKIALSWRNKR